MSESLVKRLKWEIGYHKNYLEEEIIEVMYEHVKEHHSERDEEFKEEIMRDALNYIRDNLTIDLSTQDMINYLVDEAIQIGYKEDGECEFN